MIPPRLLAGLAVSAALVALAAIAVRKRPPAPETNPAPAPAALRTEPPAPPPPPPRPRIPAGILSRAASARALDRAPSCPKAATAAEPPPCAGRDPDHEEIEIDWHVARDR